MLKERTGISQICKKLEDKPKVFSLTYFKAVIETIMEEILKKTQFCETHQVRGIKPLSYKKGEESGEPGLQLNMNPTTSSQIPDQYCCSTDRIITLADPEHLC